jgi:hypothetical protein
MPYAPFLIFVIDPGFTPPSMCWPSSNENWNSLNSQRRLSTTQLCVLKHIHDLWAAQHCDAKFSHVWSKTFLLLVLTWLKNVGRLRTPSSKHSCVSSLCHFTHGWPNIHWPKLYIFRFSWWLLFKWLSFQVFTPCSKNLFRHFYGMYCLQLQSDWIWFRWMLKN